MTTRMEKRRFVVTATALALLTLGYGATFVAAQGKAAEKVVRISAKRFDYSPAQLSLRKGEPVILELTSQDVLMGFNLPDFNLRADIEPNKVTRVRFVPDKTGQFMFLCDIFCGSGHEHMQGTLTVVD